MRVWEEAEFAVEFEDLRKSSRMRCNKADQAELAADLQEIQKLCGNELGTRQEQARNKQDQQHNSIGKAQKHMAMSVF